MFESPKLSTSLRGIRAARQQQRDRSNSDASSALDDVADIWQQLKHQQHGGQVIITAQEEQDYQSQVREACVLFTIVGVGYLFPFSALTQPIDYWNLLFPDFNMEFPLTALYMWTNLIMLGALVFGSQGTPHFTRRIVGGFIGQLLVLVAVPTSYFFHFDEGANIIAILGLTVVAAIVTAFIDSSLIALVSQYPLRVQEYFQLGVGVSTLIGSVYRDITKLAFPPDAIVESSLLYFYTGAATIGVCILAYYRLLQLPISKQCLARAEEAEVEVEAHQPHPHHHPQFDANTPATEASQLIPIEIEKPVLQTQSTSSLEPDRYEVLRKILFNEFMVLLLFLSTLALWPPLVTEIPAYGAQTQAIFESTGWWALVLLTVFSFSDCLGRLLVRFRMGWNKDNIWIAVALRFVLFPLIVGQVQGWWFANTSDGDDNSWKLDAWSAFLVGLLGLTNGYVGTLCIVLVNDCLETTQEQAIAGTFTSFFLNSGLVFGATFGLLFDALINNSSS
jgi:equilibrative nucleoside transporter 1/2/3